MDRGGAQESLRTRLKSGPKHEGQDQDLCWRSCDLCAVGRHVTSRPRSYKDVFDAGPNKHDIVVWITTPAEILTIFPLADNNSLTFVADEIHSDTFALVSHGLPNASYNEDM